jgi:L-lactate utilization protein LutC
VSERSRKQIIERIRQATGRRISSYPEAEVKDSRDRRLEHASEAELVEVFCARQEELGGRVFIEGTPETLLEALAERVRQLATGPVWVEKGLEIGGRPVLAALRQRGILSLHEAGTPPQGLSWKECLAEASVGITRADWLLAQTGSVVLVHTSDRPRSLSLLPSVHLVVAPVRILVPDLDAVIPRLGERFGTGGFPAVTVITGSSRTADIEKILVRGVHGPQILEVFLLV